MSRQAFAQTVAMLVMLWAVFRWVPFDLDAPDMVLGRGDIYAMLKVDTALWEARDNPVKVRANARAMVRGMGAELRERMISLLKEERNVHRAAQPGDLVQLKGMPRNDSFILQYYLYPLRGVGAYWEDGGSVADETLPDAHWVISGGVIPRSWETGVGAERRASDVDVQSDSGEFEAVPEDAVDDA